jgi:heterodisulfide reductase subunit A
VPALTRQVGDLADVTWAGHAGHWCLPNGLERMKAIVSEQRLDRAVIAGCAPRTHEAHFRHALDGQVNPTLISVMNLRDLCARPHQVNPVAAAAKASDQIAMAVADLAARVAAAPRTVHIVPHAVVIGGGVAGMTAALAVSDAGIPVTLVERAPDLGGLAQRLPADGETAGLVAQRMSAVRARSNITVLTHRQVTAVSGSVGCYRLTLSDGQLIEAGAIIVAIGGESNTQYPIPNTQSSAASYAFVLCDMTPERAQTCLHSCCPSALRQAAEIKRQSPGSQVAILFRELYTAGGRYDTLVREARRLGVDFCRYPAGDAPQCVDGELLTQDELTGREVRLPCDVMIPAAPMRPQPDAADLAQMLRLPVDAAGFLADARARLRPADRIERGIYVCGAAHFPCDAERAKFEAYSAAARAVHHIQRERITNWTSAATIDPKRCNGCGDCVRVCPFMAVQLQISNPKHLHCAQAHVFQISKQEDNASRLAVVDPLICTGCGNCVSVCPVKAAQVATATDEQIEAQIRAALRSPDHLVTLSPRHLVLACEWSGYSAAEIAGAQGLAYPASTRIIRLNCTGRLQPGLLLKALEMGAAGVMILGCAPGLCHYEQGNERCAAAFDQASGLAQLLAMDHRLHLEWIPPDDGARFAQVATDFVVGVESQRNVMRET